MNAQKHQEVEEARQTLRRYRMLVDEIGKRERLWVSPDIGSLVAITDPQILGNLRTMLQLKCGSLSRIVDTYEEENRIVTGASYTNTGVEL